MQVSNEQYANQEVFRLRKERRRRDRLHKMHHKIPSVIHKTPPESEI
jgi:hypothetical protein